MSKKKQKKVPEIRFSGFNDDWEQRKLAEVAKRVTRKNKNLESVLPLTISAQEGLIDQNDFFNKTVASRDVSGYYLVKKGEFAYNKSYSNGYPWGAIKRLNNYDMGVLSTLYIVFESTDIDTDFLEKYYDTTYWHKEVSKHAAEGARNHGLLNIAASNFLETDLVIPQSIMEQNKIGTFFKQLDNTIALHQRKIEALKQMKKGFLQQLFPATGENVPKVRFADFEDEWEQRKLSELATMNARIGWQNLRTSEFLDNGDYMLITGTDFKDGAIDYSNIHYVEKERFEQDKKIQISNGSILITKDGTLGKVAYVEGLTMPATLNAGVFNVRVKEDLAIDSKYLFHYLKAPFLLKFADQQSTGGTIKHLNQNVLVEFPIPLSNLEEQHKVAGLLSSFDNIIALHQNKLDQLNKLKTAFLQKMFI